MDSLSCHTAPGVIFTHVDELKAHYKSDWHRYNLKRKVAGLPVVGQELFLRVMAQAAAAAPAKQTGTGHLKRPDQAPRSVQRAQRLEQWVEHNRGELDARAAAAAEAREEEDEDEEEEEEGDEGAGDDDDDWESLDEEEAEAVLERMERMALEEEDDGTEASDAELAELELDLTESPVRLAENGYELLVTGPDGRVKRIGPRELVRYYRQRHRPSDNRPIVLATVAESRERGIVPVNAGRRSGGLGRPFMAPINILQRRAEKAQQRYEGKYGKFRMGGSGSGNKKFDMNGQNAKVKLPKACPF